MAVVGVVAKLVVLGIFASFLVFLKNEAMVSDSFYDMFEVTKVAQIIFLMCVGLGLFRSNLTGSDQVRDQKRIPQSFIEIPS